MFPAFSCSKDGETTPPKTYLDYVIKDYQALVAEYPDAKDRFVEARFGLGNVTDTDTNIVTLCALDGFENAVYEFKGDKTATV